MRRQLCLLVSLFLASWLGVPLQGQPELVQQVSGDWALQSVPSISGEVELERHLRSGLTTTLVIRINNDHREVVGQLRIDLRYELWDEFFLATTLDSLGVSSTVTLTSEEALAEWWGNLKIPLANDAENKLTSKLRASLTVIPFSRAEQDDAQRWYAESVHRGGREGGESGGISGGGDSLDRIFSVLIATSIQRRPLKTYFWEVKVPDSEPTR